MGSERHRQSRHPLSEVRCRAYSPAMSRHKGCPAACLRLLLRLLVTVTTLSAVAIDLSVDCCSVTAQLLRNQDYGKSAFLERLNLASFFVGQMTVALGHDNTSLM